jgi:hypothetical protein
MNKIFHNISLYIYMNKSMIKKTNEFDIKLILQININDLKILF